MAAAITAVILLAQSHSTGPTGLSRGQALSADPSVLPLEVTQSTRNNAALSFLSPSQRSGVLWMMLKRSIPQSPILGRSYR